MTGVRKSTIIDHAASSIETNSKLCSLETAQKGFLLTRETSRPTMSNPNNVEGCNSCPDLH